MEAWVDGCVEQSQRTVFLTLTLTMWKQNQFRLNLCLEVDGCNV